MAPRIRSQVQRCEALIVVTDVYNSILPPLTKKALKTPGRNANGKRGKRGSIMMKERLELKDLGGILV